MAAFESKLRDTRFIEFPETLVNHAVVLRLGGVVERQIEAVPAGQGRSDARVFGGMRFARTSAPA